MFDYQGILDNYLDNLASMHPQYQAHFCMRMYRITGKPFYLDQLKQNIAKNAPIVIKQLQTFPNIKRKSKKREHVRETIRRNPIENKRIIRREEYIITNPLFKEELTAINRFNYIKNYTNSKGKYQKEIRYITETFCNYAWKKNFIAKKHLLINPVFFLNATYYLKNNKVADYTNTVFKYINNEYPPSKILKKELLFDQIYTYTHIIINESLFYRKLLSETQVKKFQWIFDFFSDNFHSIYQLLNLDLILEILLCFKLAKLPPPPFEKEALGHVANFYNKERKMLQADKKATLQDMEHANILLLMYLKDPKKLYKIDKMNLI